MYNYLIHPISGNKISLFSLDGKKLLKKYVHMVQRGGGMCDNIPNVCNKCACECNLMKKYGSADSNITRQSFYTCELCPIKIKITQEQRNWGHE